MSLLSAIKDGTTPMIDVEELKGLGLNFNVIANLWLGEVDVNEDDFPVAGRKHIVPKFLNRLLGLSLNKQSLLMEYFFAFVEIEVKASKAAGKMDVGIKTLSGQSVEIVDKPRSFCFNEDCKIELFKVKVDKGMTYAAANDVFRQELVNQDDSAKIVTGLNSTPICMRNSLKSTTKALCQTHSLVSNSPISVVWRMKTVSCYGNLFFATFL